MHYHLTNPPLHKKKIKFNFKKSQYLNIFKQLNYILKTNKWTKRNNLENDTEYKIMWQAKVETNKFNFFK